MDPAHKAQPAPRVMLPPPNAFAHEQPWSSRLCDCMDDVPICCLTCCFPCITFGRIAEIVDRGSTSCGASGVLYGLIMCTGFQWIYSYAYRSKLRAQYNLPEVPCCDCCVHFCCELCGLCQEYKELQNRGFDMKIGWDMNIQRASGGMQPPFTQSGMMR